MKVPNKHCPVCGAGFTCEYELGISDCWCGADYPDIMPMDNVREGCLCPACLEKRIGELTEQRDRGERVRKG